MRTPITLTGRCSRRHTAVTDKYFFNYHWRRKAAALGVTFADINAALSTDLGSSYINDFLNRRRMQRVIVQAGDEKRLVPEDLLTDGVRNKAGDMVPFSSFARVAWLIGPTQVVRFDGYPAVRITGSPAPGYTSGDAIAEMERLMRTLPGGFGYAWTGQSLQEKLAGSQAAILLGLSILFVFLCLAALYESWSIPFAVMLAVPLGLVGSVAAAWLRGLPNDVYFTVGIVTIIGLSAKNAILIIEFAKDLRARGMPLVEATVTAAELRFRPIVMTSLAFILGMVPLVIATGASAASQQALGTGVLGGMITATVLAVFWVPVFFVVAMRYLSRQDAAAELSATLRAVTSARDRSAGPRTSVRWIGSKKFCSCCSMLNPADQSTLMLRCGAPHVRLHVS